jgi:hypothetical protein
VTQVVLFLHVILYESVSQSVPNVVLEFAVAVIPIFFYCVVSTRNTLSALEKHEYVDARSATSADDDPGPTEVVALCSPTCMDRLANSPRTNSK